jgi:hypothetical protein
MPKRRAAAMVKNGDCGLGREPHHPKRRVSRAKRLCPIMTTGRTKLGRENEIAFGLAITDSSLDDSDAAARKKGPGDGVMANRCRRRSKAVAAAGAWFDRRISPLAGTVNHVARAGSSELPLPTVS